MPLYSLGHVIVQHLHNGDVCTVRIDESKPLAILYARVALAVRVVLLSVYRSQVYTFHHLVEKHVWRPLAHGC